MSNACGSRALIWRSRATISPLQPVETSFALLGTHERSVSLSIGFSRKLTPKRAAQAWWIPRDRLCLKAAIAPSFVSSPHKQGIGQLGISGWQRLLPGIEWLWRSRPSRADRQSCEDFTRMDLTTRLFRL